jgi:sugar phosphate isomerase/epimerase
LKGHICVGWSPEEFHYAIESGIVSSTVLDFGHAVYAANSLQKSHMEFINEFMSFNPKLFHISDGNVFSEKDLHLNLGKGNLNIAEFLSVIPENRPVTIETPRDPQRGFSDFIEDVHILRDLSQKC